MALMIPLTYLSLSLSLSLTKAPYRLLRTTRAAQVEALLGALSDVLWTAGGRQRAVLCLTHSEVLHSHDDPQYLNDGCTEKVTTEPLNYHVGNV